jgi:hypothetical protein
LIVHDRDDRVNRFADAEAYRDAIASARLVATRGWAIAASSRRRTCSTK